MLIFGRGGGAQAFPGILPGRPGRALRRAPGPGSAGGPGASLCVSASASCWRPPPLLLQGRVLSPSPQTGPSPWLPSPIRVPLLPLPHSAPPPCVPLLPTPKAGQPPRSRRVSAPLLVFPPLGRCLHPGSCRDKKDCKVVFSQQDLRKRLTPLQYHVTQEKGTESAFEGEYTHHKAHGIYKCVVCGTPLFKSDTKFDSSSGWPSFFDVISPDAITFTDDFSYGMHRVETSCSQCGAHLGHIFDDGPRPTGKRYCINSASLSFEPVDKNKAGEGSSSTSHAQTDKSEL